MMWSCPKVDCPPTENAPKELTGAVTSRQLLTVDELAELLQVSRETIYTWNRKRTGPPYDESGKHIRYRSSDVQATFAVCASECAKTYPRNEFAQVQ
jgi:excisionase family DNA binding protein